MQIPMQEAEQPNLEDGFVLCGCVRGRKRYLGNPVPPKINTGPPPIKKNIGRIFSNRGSLKSGEPKIGSPGKSFKTKK